MAAVDEPQVDVKIAARGGRGGGFESAYTLTMIPGREGSMCLTVRQGRDHEPVFKILNV